MDLENLEGLKKAYYAQYREIGKLKLAYKNAKMAADRGLEKLIELQEKIKVLREKMK